MDKEQARFILSSFRPDGADVNDCDFAEALAMAMANRELGEWLAGERALDSAFASALASVELPETLRDDILGCLAGERGDYPQAENDRDATMIGALASIQPPAALREHILTAMERSAMDRPATASPILKPVWKRAAIPLAAAAGVAFAFLFSRDETPQAVAQVGPLPVEVVQAGFIRTFESPLFSLDETREDHQLLIASLKSRKLPCPCCLPPGLEGVKGVGCRELVIDGKRGSLICFDERDAGVVHMVIFRREDVSGVLPERDRPSFAKNGSWATARWENHSNVFILIGHTDVDKLAALF